MLQHLDEVAGLEPHDRRCLEFTIRDREGGAGQAEGKDGGTKKEAEGKFHVEEIDGRRVVGVYRGGIVSQIVTIGRPAGWAEG
jgi:hypothetical protein